MAYSIVSVAAVLLVLPIVPEVIDRLFLGKWRIYWAHLSLIPQMLINFNYFLFFSDYADDLLGCIFYHIKPFSIYFSLLIAMFIINIKADIHS